MTRITDFHLESPIREKKEARRQWPKGDHDAQGSKPIWAMSLSVFFFHLTCGSINFGRTGTGHRAGGSIHAWRPTIYTCTLPGWSSCRPVHAPCRSYRWYRWRIWYKKNSGIFVGTFIVFTSRGSRPQRPYAGSISGWYCSMAWRPSSWENAWFAICIHRRHCMQTKIQHKS